MPTRLTRGCRLPARQVLTLALALTFLAGCGKGSGKKEVASDDQGDEQATAADADGGASTKSRKPGAKKKTPQGKTVKGIPLDVWPEVWLKDPLAVAAEKGLTSGAVPSATGDSVPQVAKTDSDTKPSGDTEKPAAASRAAPAAGGSELAALISGEDLADETKAIKSSMTDKLQSVGKYSGNYKALRDDAAVLAVLAAIAIDHPEAPSWKPNAKYIRDSAGEISRASEANGDRFYKPAREAFDKVETLLSGSKPAKLDDAAETLPFSEVAKRNFLMNRMQRAYDFMKLNVNTEAIFKKENAKVNHEAAIVAILSKAIATRGYDDADDDDYRKYARELTESSQQIEKAVKDQDFMAYTSALDRCYKACSDCHSNFRNN